MSLFKHHNKNSKFEQLRKMQKCWVWGLFQTTTDFSMHKITPFYQSVWDIRICVEVQFWRISLGSASRMPAGSTSSLMIALILLKRSQIPSPQSSGSAHSLIGKHWYRCRIGLANCWSFFFFIFISSFVGVYRKPYFDPLVRTRTGSMIPWEYFPNPKPSSNPFCIISVVIILYMTGMGVYGAKSSSMAFTNCTM